MGIVDESHEREIEEFRRLLLSSATGVRRRKDEDEFGHRRVTIGDENNNAQEKLVCVTSGVSFVGLAIVNQLLARGYSVRIIVDNQEDTEKLREMREGNNTIEVVKAQLTHVESLLEAFNGCCGVIHSAAFIDPAGLSGYSKWMGEIEVKATENVTEACAITPSVRNCVFTSSLLACIWRHSNVSPSVIDHDCWSDEALCVDKKLWYALGKLRAEKAAWRIARERGLKLATLCPGLITGPEYFPRNPTPTIAYLKGALEMYANGLLAIVDVNRLAEAHVCVFEAMNETAFGRYICFDKVIGSEYEVEKLARETGLQTNTISGNASSNSLTRFTLSNMKLSRLISSRRVRCNKGC